MREASTTLAARPLPVTSADWSASASEFLLDWNPDNSHSMPRARNLAVPLHAANISENMVTAALTCAAGVRVSAMPFGNRNLVSDSGLSARFRKTLRPTSPALACAMSSYAIFRHAVDG